jgi:putative endonuclease
MRSESILQKITLYVIQGISSGKRYVGITRNLEKRLHEHRRGDSKGGQVIGSFKLIYTEEFQDYSSARKQEIFLKSGQGRNWLNNHLKTLSAKSG